MPESISWYRFTLAWEKTFAAQYSLRPLNGFPRDTQQVSEFVDIINAAAADKPIVVICDDYHNVDNNPKIRKLAEQLAQEEIPNFHIVLLSRHLTQLNYALLASKGLCYIINTEILAFTHDEIIDYFALNGLADIESSLLSRITDFAEGWPAAVVLTQMSVQKNSHIPVLDMDYLMHECLNSLFDSKSRELLSKLSFLEEFSLPQAVYILETRDIVNIIDIAMEQNSFIYFDYKTNKYRLHALARIFLQKQVQNKALDLSRIKYLNAIWLIDNNNIYESIKYFIDTGNSLELMQRLNERRLGHLCYLNTKLFYKLCKSLPEETCLKYPIPYLHMILNFIMSGEREILEFGKNLLQLMDQYFTDSNCEQTSLIMAEIEIVKAASNFSDVYLVMKHTHKALLLFAGRNSQVAVKSDPTSLGIPMYTYIYFKHSGDLKNLVDFHRSEFVPILSTYDIMHGVDQLLLAEHALETGELEQAKLHAQLATYISLNRKSFSVAICAAFTLIRYDFASNTPELASERLSAIKQMLLDNRATILAETGAIHNTTIALCEAYININLGKLELVPTWIKDGDLSGGTFKLGGLGFINILRSKILMQEGRWVELKALLPIFEQTYSHYHNQFGLLHNSLCLAIVKYNLCGLGAGCQELLKLLAQSEQDHIIMLIAENAKYILPMLRHLHYTKQLTSKYFKQLLDVSNNYEKTLTTFTPTPPTVPTIHFTDREREVLQLLKQGLMGREIANQLCLSLVAVKKHLSSVYKKLGVTHKGAAIKKLHDLKIT